MPPQDRTNARARGATAFFPRERYDYFMKTLPAGNRWRRRSKRKGPALTSKPARPAACCFDRHRMRRTPSTGRAGAIDSSGAAGASVDWEVPMQRPLGHISTHTLEVYALPWANGCSTCYPHIPIGKVSIYRLLFAFFCLFVCVRANI